MHVLIARLVAPYIFLFLLVEVLRPSQPIIVMLSQLIYLSQPLVAQMRIPLGIRRLQVQPQPAQLHPSLESDHKIFLSLLPSANSRRAFISFWQKSVHRTGKLLRGLNLPSRSVIR